MEFKEVEAKSVLVKSGIPGVDYVVNAYTGCQFACKYCYASFMGRFVGKEVSDWGNYVYAKVNAPDVLGKELLRLKDKGVGKEIFISSVTDPYQGIEAKYQLTRKCLEQLVDFGFEGVVSILTKSPLVTRDLDLFKKVKNIVVGLTITSTDDSISRYFETYAPNVSDRIKALKELNQAGIRTYAFVGPLLPHYVDCPEVLEKVLLKIKETGTTDIFVENLNLAPYIRQRLIKEMGHQDREIIRKFYESQTKDYRQDIQVLVSTLVKKHGMRLLHDTVIFHNDSMKEK